MKRTQATQVFNSKFLAFTNSVKSVVRRQQKEGVSNQAHGMSIQSNLSWFIILQKLRSVEYKKESWKWG